MENTNGITLLRVSDNGNGIRTECQDKIFDMFYRASESGSGSGLGLYIVKEIVDKMKGTVSFKSSPAQGTDFIVSLPNN